MEVKIETGEAKLDPKMFGPHEAFDWTGRWRNRHEQVIRQQANTKGGQRQWLVRCDCGGQYVVAEAMLSDHRIVICPRSAPRTSTANHYWTNRRDTLTNWRR